MSTRKPVCHPYACRCGSKLIAGAWMTVIDAETYVVSFRGLKGASPSRSDRGKEAQETGL